MPIRDYYPSVEAADFSDIEFGAQIAANPSSCREPDGSR